MVYAFLLLILSIKAYGTAQIPDILIYKGDTLSMFECPLDYFPNKGLIHPKRLFGGSGCFYTACYRNYIATWTIEKDKLYLLSIRNACYPTDMKYVNASYNSGADTLGTEYANLETLFPDRFENGRVLADWVNSKIISPKGKILYYFNDGFMSIFEKELEFKIENGTLIQIQEFDNSKTRISKYTQDPELIKEFIKPYFGLRLFPVWHVGTDYLSEIAKNWYDYLVSKGVEFVWETKVTSIDFDNQMIICGEFGDKYDELIFAVGKSGIDFAQELANKYELPDEPKSVQIGVRFEAPQKHFQKLIDISYDFKLYRKFDNEGVSLRSFCTNNNAAYVSVK